jgi:hypothetical protein
MSNARSENAPAKDDPAHPKHLLTETGVGYRLLLA